MSHLPVHFFDCPVYFLHTADWFRMPFGVVGWLGPRMRQVVGVGDCRMARSNFQVDVGHSIVTNGDFAA